MGKAKIFAVAILSAGLVGVTQASNVCTGASAAFTQTECANWIAGYDALGGAQWTKFNSAGNCRRDPLQCVGEASLQYQIQGTNFNIEQIWFNDNNIQGTLAPEWGNLQELKFLVIRNSLGLHGTIPASYGSHIENVAICAAETNLYGAIPQNWATLSFCNMAYNCGQQTDTGNHNLCWNTVPQEPNENNCGVTEQCAPTPAPTPVVTPSPTPIPTHLAVTSGVCTDVPGFYPIYDATECENVPASVTNQNGLSIYLTSENDKPINSSNHIKNTCSMIVAPASSDKKAQSNNKHFIARSDNTGTECSTQYPCLCQYKGKTTTPPQPHPPVTTPSV